MRDACLLFLVGWFSTVGYLAGSTEDPPYWALFLVSITAIPVMLVWSLLVEDLQSDHAGDRAERGGFMDLLARLGNFIYGVGATLAFFLFIGGVLAFAENKKGAYLIMCWVAAAISYAIGTAVRYILAGGRRT
jgi:hypothetical protein